MAGISFDGIASGLDTTALIGAILSADKMPVMLMEERLAEGQNQVKALRQLNTLVAELATKTSEMSEGSGFRPVTGTSTLEGVTVTVADGATPTSLDFSVDAVAARHSGVSAPLSGWDGSELVITTADGTAHTFTGTSLNDVATNVNAAAGLGVSATLVRAGTDAEGNTLHRLQLVSNTTGTAGSFTATAGGTDLFDPANGGALTSTGADAQITLFAGTAAAQTITSSSNTFGDLATGVDITVSAAAVGQTASVTAENDPAAATDKAQALVTEINSILETLKLNTTVTSGTGTSGDETKAGLFVGDSTVRSLQNSLFTAAVRPADGSSQSWMGIEPDRNGQLTFDAETFAEALAADPSAVATALADLAGRVSTAADTYSDEYDGMLTTSIENRVTDNRRTQDSITDAERRIEMREATLRARFTAMELAIAKANDLQKYLTGQFAMFADQSSNNNS
ncbi:flagellar filament capping protein FliD [Citricoccus sp. GCM10030269]|uniref:flagellar filament capping protein FliD n=1 Tax=Citricoccus sp. GCM10030269 TaxID=3273388 RepID=UPI0036107D09